MKSLVDLTLLPEHCRGHKAMYGGLNHGRIDVDRLRTVLTGLALPRFDGGAPGLGGRCVAVASLGCPVLGGAPVLPRLRSCQDGIEFIPSWPYSFVAVLESGATSWTAILDAVRLGPADDATAITAAQLRGVVERLIAAGQWQTGDPHIVIVSDAGYDATRLAWVLRDLPVELVGRVRSDRVMRLPKPPRVHDPKGGRPQARPGIPLHQARDLARVRDHHGHGHDQLRQGRDPGMDRVHPRLTHRSSWLDHDGELLLVEGTLMRLEVAHLSKERDAPPVWLWSSKTGATPDDVDLFWQVFLRRFDLEHTFRFAKQTLGWTTPKLRTPEAADRWTWILIVAHTQLRLARPLAADLRRPWEKPTTPDRLTPVRVRRGFRNIRAHLTCPTRVLQPRGAGPGRPPGAKNKHRAPRYDVCKTVKHPETLKAIGKPGRSW
ncbi:transposase [Streptomyces sp. NPDC006475]|uniref:transposase n=1 Tax=Streptomyces sp. NPDC006475 TaxID=3155719 RepID=UPI0033B0FDAB